jgi:hypothetical protein
LIVAVPLFLATLLTLELWSDAKIRRSLKVAREERAKADALATTKARARARAQEQTTIAESRAEALAWEDYINRVNRAYREV